MDVLQDLKKITNVLLKEETDYVELKTTLGDYKALLLELSETNIDSSENRSNVQLDSGVAIGTSWAIFCIDDFVRTKKFVKGLFRAVKDLKNKREKPLHILYAGCGPFATLALPLLASYSEEEIQFTLLEINKQSYETAQNVIEKLGFKRHIKAFRNVDATKYKISESERVDILLSETMQRALEKEQQVTILIHLLRQLDKNVVLIPEKITLFLGLRNLKDNLENSTAIDRVMTWGKVEKVFELSKAEMQKIEVLNREENGEINFPEKTVNLPEEVYSHDCDLAILTEIQVYDQEKITTNESGLTLPLIIENVPQPEGEEMKIKMQYKIDATPGLIYKFN